MEPTVGTILAALVMAAVLWTVGRVETKARAKHANKAAANAERKLALIAAACRDKTLSNFACRITVLSIAEPVPTLTPDDIAWAKSRG